MMGPGEAPSAPVAVLLGGNALNRGVMDRLRAHGLGVIVADWSPDSPLKGDRFLQVDVKDPPQVLAALESLGCLDVRGVWTSIDVAVPTALAIRRRFGLRTPAGETCGRPLTKEWMTTVWKRAGLLNRVSVLVDDTDGMGIPPELRGIEIIVKPNLSSSSRGITTLPADVSPEVRDEALRRALRISLDGRAIVEELFRGREYSVELLGDHAGNVSVYGVGLKYHTANAGANYVASKIHYNPMNVDSDDVERLADYGRRCYRSLGLNGTPGHLELLMNEEGLISPVEIGARSGGFIGSPLADIASGRDYVGDFLDVLRGGGVDGECHRSGESSMYFFYDFPPGQRCLRVTDLTRHLPAGIESLYHDRTAIQPGRVYGTLDNETQRHGYEILRGPRSLLTIEAVESAERRMLEEMFSPNESP